MQQAEIIVPIEEKRVGFGKRFGGYFIDAVILILLSIIFSAVGSSFIDPYVETLVQEQLANNPNADQMPEFVETITRYSMTIGFVGNIVGMLMSLMELLTGASPGKMILRMQIAHPDGKRGNIGLWAPRWLLKQFAGILSLVSMFLGMKILGTVGSILGVVFFFGCFFALSQKKQALHDIIAKTAIFNNEDITD